MPNELVYHVAEQLFEHSYDTEVRKDLLVTWAVIHRGLGEIGKRMYYERPAIQLRHAGKLILEYLADPSLLDLAKSLSIVDIESRSRNEKVGGEWRTTWEPRM